MIKCTSILNDTETHITTFNIQTDGLWGNYEIDDIIKYIEVYDPSKTVVSTEKATEVFICCDGKWVQLATNKCNK